MGRVSGESVVCTNGTGCTHGSTLYSFSSGWKGTYLTSSSDSVEGLNATYSYDALGHLSTMTGGPGNFSWTYDRWGNRWTQSGNAPQPNLSFNNNNQVSGNGYAYDAAGNMTSDGVNSYTYDAEGNVTQVKTNGSVTATYTYDALNQRVATSAYSEFLFDPQGRKVSEWDSVDKWEVTGWNYWGNARLSFYFAGTTRFEHQDWLGTERARTSTSGAVTESFGSLPFGDDFTYNAPEGDFDYYHFAGYDQDNSANEHAQFREYSNMAGRWFSPDPYQGSYDPANPQSFNRYAYVQNNPLSYVDPLGLTHCEPGRDGKINCTSSGGGTDCSDPSVACVTAGDGGCVVGDPSCDPTQPGGGCPQGYSCGGGNGGGRGGRGSGGGSAPNNQKGCSVLDPNCKKPGPVAKYLSFLACEYNDTIEQITDQEDGQGTNTPSATPAAKLTTIPLLVYGIVGPTKPWVKVTSTVTLSSIMIGTAVHANEACSPSFFGN